MGTGRRDITYRVLDLAGLVRDGVLGSRGACANVCVVILGHLFTCVLVDVDRGDDGSTGMTYACFLPCWLDRPCLLGIQ